MKGHMQHITDHLHLDEFENSPIKVLKFYFEENRIGRHTTSRTPSKLQSNQTEETEIFKNRETSGKSLKQIIGGMRYFKNLHNIKASNSRSRKKAPQVNGLSEIGLGSISLHTNPYTGEKIVCSTKRTALGNQVEVKRNQSVGKVCNESKVIYKKLENIRIKYKEGAIRNFKKMIKLDRWN